MFFAAGDAMIRNKKQADPSSCPPWEFLLRHVIQAEGLTRRQRESVADHIAHCERCANMYEALCDANAELWDQAAKAAGVPRRELHFTRSPEEALTDLWRRIDEDQSSQRRQRRWAMVSRISGIAAAACILIAIGVGWITLRNGNPSQPISGIAANSNGSSKGFVELVTGQGRKPLAMNQSVTTDGQPQEVLLGGIHRVVMNRNTKATFTAVSTSAAREGSCAQDALDSKIPYEIQLARGELYVEVVPGHPFTVRTDNAQLDITGTKFNVLAEGDKTELTLLKGSVRFSQPVAGNAASATNSFVDVTTGHTSTITGRSAPIEPRETDAMTATAWARDLTLTNAIASAQSKAGLDLLESIRKDGQQPKSLDLDSIDYVKWRDDHRDWFAIEFPWIFKIQKVLKDQHGINADYIELLMISGDIWQFNYDPKLPAGQSLTKIEPAAITRLARYYGLDEREMLKTIGLPDLALTATTPVQNGTPGQLYAEGLCRWHDAIMTAPNTRDNPKANDGLKLFSLYASQYLAETRTAAYLWAKNHPEKVRQLLADKEYLAILPTPLAMTNNSAPDVNAWLEQIHDQANTARSCVPAAMEWLLAPQEARCQPLSLQKQRTLTGHVARLISIAGVGESESPCKLVIPANRGRLFMSCQKE